MLSTREPISPAVLYQTLTRKGFRLKQRPRTILAA